MSLSVETLAVARKYTDDSLAGAGAVAGVPCKIQSITAITGGNRVTFLWTDNNGDDHTSAMDVMNGVDGEDGKGIQSVSVNAQNHLIITYSDGTTVDAGQIEIHSAVDSVNGQTGAVVLDAEDVGALPDNTPIPSKTSDLTNDSGFATTSDVSTALADYTKTADLTTLLAAKQDTLTFDNAPTENSNNPVKSGGVYAANQTLTSAFVNNINENGCKNLLPNKATTQVSYGVTFTVNDDGSVKANGTNNGTQASVIFPFGVGRNLVADYFPSMDKTYVGYMSASNTLLELLIIWEDENKTTISQTRTKTKVEFTIPSNAVYFRCDFRVAQNATVSNEIAYPMICLKSIYDLDDTFEPYAKTNRQLTTDKVGWDDYSELGAVNVLDVKSQTMIHPQQHNLSFTTNPDKSVTLVKSGSISSTAWFHFTSTGYISEKIDDPFGATPMKYRALRNGAYTGILVKITLFNSSGTELRSYTDEGNGVVFSDASAATYDAFIQINTNCPNGTYTFYPMIAPVSYNGGYVPPAKTNKELTDDVSDIAYESLTDYGSSEYTLTEGKMWQTKGVTFLYVAVTCTTVSPIENGNHIQIATIPSKFKKPQFNMYPTICNYRDGSSHIGAQLQVQDNGTIAIRGGEAGARYAGLFSF